MKYGNMSYFERKQKYDMKYEIWRAWAKIWNMKYENSTDKNVTISGFFSPIWNMKTFSYEKRNFIFLGSNMKYGNMSYFEREQKYNMKYEIWRAWAKYSKNMKYEIWKYKNSTDKKRNYFGGCFFQYEIWKLFHMKKGASYF